MRTKRVFHRVLAFLIVSCAVSASAQLSVTTYHNDNLRTGQNTQELILTTTNVNATNFGKLFSQPIDGYSYSQPLYLQNVAIPGQGTHNVVYVATMNDSVYAFDADSNSGSNAQPLWQVSFTDAAKGITTLSTGDLHCTDTITTQVGIMSTPVIDASSGTLYVLARTVESGTYYHRLHALDIGTGDEKFGGPVVISATVSGTGTGSKSGTISFDPKLEAQRPALLLQNGLVYVGWGSLCDYGSYHGWVMAYDAQTLSQTAAWITTPNGSKGGIWQAGNGLAGDSSFNTYFPVGNGTFDADSGGSDYGQGVVKLGPPQSLTFPMADYFTTYDAKTYNTSNQDVGSAGLTLLPNQTGPVAHLLVQGDKSGNLYLINRDNMGHYNSTNNNQIVQYLPGATTGMYSSPAWWNNYVYVGSQANYLQSYAFNPITGLLSTTPTKSAAKFGYPGTTVSISSNGTKNGIVWALNNASYKSTTGQATLRAFNATNLKLLYSSVTNASRDNPGAAVKFAVPTVINGKVYIITQKNLVVYGLLN